MQKVATVIGITSLHSRLLEYSQLDLDRIVSTLVESLYIGYKYLDRILGVRGHSASSNVSCDNTLSPLYIPPHRR